MLLMRLWSKGTSLVQPNLRCSSQIDVFGRLTRRCKPHCLIEATGFSSRIPVQSLIPFIAFNDLLTGPLPGGGGVCVTAMTSHWRLAFRLFFGLDLTGTCGDLTDLTAGDFRVVKSKADILGIEDPAELMAMLVSESEAKPGRTRQIGY